MRHFDSSRPFEISLGLSLLLHLCLFLYFYYYNPDSFKEVENPPISVEYISPHKDELKIEKPFSGGDKKGTVAKLKAGKPGAPMAAPEPHPLEVQKTPSLPGIKELTPSLDQLTKADEKKGGEGEEGREDEETVDLDSTDFKYTSYLHGVKFKIEGVWRYPEAAKRSALQGGGVVSFTIQRDGSLSDLKLLSSSGYPVLDEAILKAIRDAAPFNPMTDNMPVKKLKIVASFEYDLVVQRIWGQ